jgi:hypothetical protein
MGARRSRPVGAESLYREIRAAANLRNMRQLYLAFPIHHAPRDKSPALRKELSGHARLYA